MFSLFHFHCSYKVNMTLSLAKCPLTPPLPPVPLYSHKKPCMHFVFPYKCHHAAPELHAFICSSYHAIWVTHHTLSHTCSHRIVIKCLAFTGPYYTNCIQHSFIVADYTSMYKLLQLLCMVCICFLPIFSFSCSGFTVAFTIPFVLQALFP